MDIRAHNNTVPIMNRLYAEDYRQLASLVAPVESVPENEPAIYGGSFALAQKMAAGLHTLLLYNGEYSVTRCGSSCRLRGASRSVGHSYVEVMFPTGERFVLARGQPQYDEWLPFQEWTPGGAHAVGEANWAGRRIVLVLYPPSLVDGAGRRFLTT